MKVLISNQSKTPIYQQVIDQIKQQILKGDLKEGEALPSIRLLAKELQISVITSKRAYEELEKEGLIYSAVGKGSFVAYQTDQALREKRIQEIESKMRDVLRDCRNENVSIEEAQEMLAKLYRGMD
ncbi:GntR family transcriptional regulator [Bacillus mangrovi]|uniref:GntR family transcriptional regulator n=1 Tax=Metabacillus mangrovi TaxID=1491830 RepID=A0A7X2S4K3_9BACI|nr:GntR family transcriptional regulator [Metabacillus mangrovi]MTH53287.1 GntR family transcriptional regulator [Metabacillus mangrovi]